MEEVAAEACCECGEEREKLESACCAAPAPSADSDGEVPPEVRV